MPNAPFDVNIVPASQGEVVQTTGADGARVVQDPLKVAQIKLKAVLGISQALARAKAVEEILPKVLTSLMTEIFPIADRGSIMLLDRRTRQMIPTAQRCKHEGDDSTVEMSRTVLDHVLEQKQGVRSMDAGTDQRFQSSASIMMQGVRSMMCAPMLSLEGEAIGIIHLDTQSQYLQFNADDMDLLMAIAGQAALAYDSACQMLRQQEMRSEMEIARHRALSQMVSGLAHELNTPLGIINSASSVIGDTVKELRSGDLDEEVNDELEDVEEAVGLLQKNLTRANHLITDFKKLSSRQLGDSREVVDIGGLVKDVVDAAATQSEHPLSFRNHLEPGVTWDGFPGHLTQLLLSCLDNARQHAYPEAQGSIEVHLSRHEVEGRAIFRLQVIDFGVGIDPAHHEEVFVPFFTTCRNKGHRGLGLAIVRTIAQDSLQGTVALHAAPGRGTMVVIDVPVQVAERHE